MNHYVFLSLTNKKSSVHLHASYSPRIALGSFTPRSYQLVKCGQYSTTVLMAMHATESTLLIMCYLNYSQNW
jgi:hypothetical protein